MGRIRFPPRDDSYQSRFFSRPFMRPLALRSFLRVGLDISRYTSPELRVPDGNARL